MARPKSIDPTPQETLVTAYALRKVPGGWVMRTYLVPEGATPQEDSAVDTFGAAAGRLQREIARAAK